MLRLLHSRQVFVGRAKLHWAVHFLHDVHHAIGRSLSRQLRAIADPLRRGVPLIGLGLLHKVVVHNPVDLFEVFEHLLAWVDNQSFLRVLLYASDLGCTALVLVPVSLGIQEKSVLIALIQC